MAIQNGGIISLCTGYGGIDLGLRLAGVEARCSVYVERDLKAARLLVTRIEAGDLDPADIWSDVKTFDARPYKGSAYLTAGYPCQPFSVAGKRLGTKDPRHIWPWIAGAIYDAKPRRVFLENVDAHLRLGFREVAGELHAMGYRVAAGLFSSEETGNTHRRVRLFALAERLENSSRAGRNGRERENGGRGRRVREAVLGLDDANGVGRGPQCEICAGRDCSKLPGSKVANAIDGGRFPKSGRRSQGRTGVRQTGASLAVCPCGRCGELRQPSGGCGFSDGCGSAMADAGTEPSTARKRLHPDGRSHSAARSRVSGQKLADCDGRRLSELCASYDGNGRDASGNGVDRCGPAMVDAHNDNGRAGTSRISSGARIGRRGSERASLPLFAPGPEAYGEWARVLERNPEVKPAVRGVAYGTASRVDRLRLLGNGVDALVVAHAFRTLDAALGVAERAG